MKASPKNAQQNISIRCLVPARAHISCQVIWCMDLVGGDNPYTASAAAKHFPYYLLFEVRIVASHTRVHMATWKFTHISRVQHVYSWRKMCSTLDAAKGESHSCLGTHKNPIWSICRFFMIVCNSVMLFDVCIISLCRALVRSRALSIYQSSVCELFLCDPYRSALSNVSPLYFVSFVAIVVRIYWKLLVVVRNMHPPVHANRYCLCNSPQIGTYW